MMATSVGTDSVTRRRPIGVWILTVCNSIFAAIGIYNVSPGLDDPPPHAWSPVAAQWAPYVIALLASIIVAAWGTWAGSRVARIALLVLGTIMVGLNLQEDYYGVPFLLSMAEKDSALWRDPTFYWDLSLGARWVVYLAFNYWYFLGARTRAFYSTSSARSG